MYFTNKMFAAIQNYILYFAKRIVMNKIYTLLLMALALSLLVFWKSYEKKETEPFCVTYHVAVHRFSHVE